MSNPFDQFAADFQAALPAGAPSAAPPAGAYDPNASLMAQPPAAKPPVMNAPVMNAPPGAPGGYGAPPQGAPGGYGQQPQYGMPPQQQQQPPMQSSMNGMGGMNSQQSIGGGMMGTPPPASGPPPAGSFGGGPPASASFGGPPAPAGGFGGPPAPAGGFGGGPPAPAGGFGGGPPAAGSFGGPPPPGAGSFGGPPPPAAGGFGGPPQPAPGGFGGFDPTPSVASQQTSNTFGAPPASQPDPGNPFGAPAAPPAADPNPFGAPPAAPPSQDMSNPFGAPAPLGGPPPATDTGFGPPPPGQQPGFGPPPPMDGGFGAPPANNTRSSFVSQGAPQDIGFGAPPGGTRSSFVSQGSGPPLGQQPGYPGAPPPGAPGNDPYGAPNPYGAPPPAAPTMAAPTDPWASPGAPPADPNMGALVPAQQQSNPYAAYGAPPPQQQPPAYSAPPPQQQPPTYGAPPPQQPPQQALTPYGGPPAADPFSVFEQQSAPPAPPPAPPAPMSNALVPAAQAQAPPASDNLWGDLGFDAPPAAEPPAPAPAVPEPAAAPAHTEEKKTADGSLPPGGEYYDARIFTPTLGVMFFKPQELTDSLFLNTDQSIVDGLAERPVVAFIVEGSSARAAGVELGHVLLKVNGVDVRNPKEASRLIKEGPRPLPLLFYVPNTDVVVAEGEHMVKYDTRETTAPNSAKDWKPKYVVIGGIIAQPWMMNMYRSKSEYDIAVIETQARRPVSVKVKQFSLQGARIQNDWQGPQMVKYKNKIHPWKYIVILPVARNPIKISSPNLAQLKPVHEGIRRVLLAQNRDRSYNSQPPVRHGHNGHHDGYHNQQIQQYHGQQQQYNY